METSLRRRTKNKACFAAALLIAAGQWLALPAPLRAQEAVRVAVLPLDAFSAEAVPTEPMTERLRAQLAEAGGFMVLPVKAASGECASRECAVEAAKGVKATLAVYGRVSELDAQNWVLSATMITVPGGESVRSITVPESGSPSTQFPEGITSLANRLVGVRAPSAAQPGATARPQRARRAVDRRRIAIFPVLALGLNDPVARRFLYTLLEAVRNTLSSMRSVSVDYVYDEEFLGAKGSAMRFYTAKSLQSDKEIGSDAWEFGLSRTPNKALALRKCEQLDVDAVLLLKLTAGARLYYEISLADINQGSVIEANGSVGTLGSANPERELASSLRNLLSR